MFCRGRIVEESAIDAAIIWAECGMDEQLRMQTNVCCDAYHVDRYLHWKETRDELIKMKFNDDGTRKSD